MSGQHPRTIFVAAPSEHGAHLAQQLLRAADLEPASVLGPKSDAALTGETLGDQVASASGVLGVVTAAGLSPKVAYEVGLAAGLGLPVVILQLVGKDDRPREVPADLRSLFQVRWDPAQPPNRSLVARLHDLFVVDMPSPSIAPRVRVEEGSRRFADETERRVAAALAAVAESVVAEGPGNTIGIPDLAAWVPELPNWANPVLIEVKGRDLSGRGHGAAIQRLRAYMAESRIALGLVVVPGPHEAEWHSEEGTAIAVLGIDTLEQLSREDVLGVLSRGRNIVVHGG